MFHKLDCLQLMTFVFLIICLLLIFQQQSPSKTSIKIMQLNQIRFLFDTDCGSTSGSESGAQKTVAAAYSDCLQAAVVVKVKAMKTRIAAIIARGR